MGKVLHAQAWWPEFKSPAPILKAVWQHTPAVLMLGRWRLADPWDSLARQPSWTSERKVQGETLLQKSKVGSDWGGHVTQPLTWASTCTHVHMYLHTGPRMCTHIHHKCTQNTTSSGPKNNFMVMCWCAITFFVCVHVWCACTFACVWAQVCAGARRWRPEVDIGRLSWSSAILLVETGSPTELRTHQLTLAGLASQLTWGSPASASQVLVW